MTEKLTPDYHDQDFKIIYPDYFPSMFYSLLANLFSGMRAELLGRTQNEWMEIIDDSFYWSERSNGIDHYECLFSDPLKFSDMIKKEVLVFAKRIIEQASEEDLNRWGFGYLIHRDDLPENFFKHRYLAGGIMTTTETMRERFEKSWGILPGEVEILQNGEYANFRLEMAWRGYQQGQRDLIESLGDPVAYIQHHKGGDNLEWDNPGGSQTPLYKLPEGVQK